MQVEEQIHADISRILFCIYNNYPIDEYFKQLMRIQQKLKEWRSATSPKLVFDIFVENIKEFIKGIKIRIIKEMKERGIIQRVQLQRRYSYDDFFLVDNSNSSYRNFGINGHYNEFIGHGINYLMGDQYELVRKLARQKMWRQTAANKYRVL